MTKCNDIDVKKYCFKKCAFEVVTYRLEMSAPTVLNNNEKYAKRL